MQDLKKKLYNPTNVIISDSSMSLNSSEFILVNIVKFGCGISTKSGAGTFLYLLNLIVEI